MGDLITRGELRGLPPTDSSVVEQKQVIQKVLDTQIQHYEQVAKPMPEPLKDYTEDIKKEYELFYSNFGVNNISWPEIVYTDTKIPEGDSLLGFCIPGLVVVREPSRNDPFMNELVRGDPTLSPEAQRNISFIGVAQTLAHELFHSTAPSVVAERYHKASKIERIFGKKNERIVAAERTGLHFQQTLRHKSGGAIEEGLASMAAYRMNSIIEKHFPNEWDYVSKPAFTVFASEGLPLESFSVTGVLSNPESITLVKELLATVPEFERLAVKARMNHEMLPLARAIESVYGPKSYQKIMSATEETAAKILKELQAKPIIRFGRAGVADK